MQSDVESRHTRDTKITMRATSRQEQVIKAAATAADKTLTDFVLDVAVSQAERVLADRRYFLVTEEQWAEFDRLLSEPLPATPKLEALLAEPDYFTAP